MSLEKKINLFTLKKNNSFTIEAEPLELEEFKHNLIDFNVLQVKNITCEVIVEKNNNFINVYINTKAVVIQECGNTLDEIESLIKFKIHHIYKLNVTLAKITKIVMDDSIINHSDNNKNNNNEEEILDTEIINIKDIILEEMMVEIDPYVTKEDSETKEYIEEKIISNPFEKFINSQNNK
ncbi:hypothetical protein ACFX5K_01930 [Rickettsiales bacterium LUAb2]